MKTRILLASVLLVGACASEERDAYDRLARQANPILRNLRATVAEVLGERGDDPASTALVIDACAGADGELAQLRSLEYEDAIRVTDHDQLSEIAADLVDYRRVYCRNLAARPDGAGTCKRWCIQHWQALATEVDRLRDAARSAGASVQLEPLVVRAKQ